MSFKFAVKRSPTVFLFQHKGGSTSYLTFVQLAFYSWDIWSWAMPQNEVIGDNMLEFFNMQDARFICELCKNEVPFKGKGRFFVGPRNLVLDRNHYPCVRKGIFDGDTLGIPHHSQLICTAVKCFTTTTAVTDITIPRCSRTPPLLWPLITSFVITTDISL